MLEYKGYVAGIEYDDSVDETFEWECERCQMREYSAPSNAKEHGGKVL